MGTCPVVQERVPVFLKHQPVYHGMPVPFTVMWVDGVPDFRVIDHEKVRRCVSERLCAICGRRLGEFLWFIGGPKSLEESHLFLDPPMHEHCARFAMQTCPFLNGTITKHNEARPLPEVVQINHMMTKGRSEKVGIRKAKDFELVNINGYGMMRVNRWQGKPIWLA